MRHEVPREQIRSLVAVDTSQRVAVRRMNGSLQSQLEDLVLWATAIGHWEVQVVAWHYNKTNDKIFLQYFNIAIEHVFIF